ncbi:MAG: acylneuraminate cytidylyltransferase family protein [Candidatus Brocadiae bacterium]|nr:acylneuraminate cytidylyltransferase family protein [Candidatus Brocadiia bacterium]
MLNGLRLLAVVPARGGSKGVPLKNLHPLAGRPLIAHVADVVREAGVIDRCVVSTDHEEIARVAEGAGIAAPFRRPESLSGDRIGDLEVLVHALREAERLDGVAYDVVLMLQPTSPLRRAAHVLECARAVAERGFDAAWTVTATDLKYHPLKALVADASGGLGCFDPRGAAIVARQQLTPVFHRNGAAYAFSRSCLLDQKTILGKRTAPVVIDEPMVSIDTLEDFARVEAALRTRSPRG